MNKLIRELSDDDANWDDDVSDAPEPTDVDLDKPWFKEFHQYLKVPKEELGNLPIVQWWGVSTIFLQLIPPYILALRSMPRDFLYGHLLHVITWRLWHHQYPVNKHSHPPGSLSVNGVIDLDWTSSKHSSFSSACTAMIILL